jgi:error-prone DNA polymerase
VRLGLRLVSGLPEAEAQAIVAARGEGYASVPALWARSGVTISVLERLAGADAFRSLGLERRQALWAVKGLDGGVHQARTGRATSSASPLLAGSTGDLFAEQPADLPLMSLGEHVVEDYTTLTLSLKAHPCAFFREELMLRGVISSRRHWDERLAGRYVTVGGLVLVRQRPGTAKGVIFLTLEDETGIVNVVVWPKVFEANRRTVMSARFLLVSGRIQREGLVIHVVAERFVDLSDELARLSDPDRIAEPPPALAGQNKIPFAKSRNFH